jgi:tetratricopeptide (TPR) repeat protein
MKSESQNLNVYYNQRGIAKGQDGQFDSAIEDYKNAIRNSPGYAQAYYNLGNLQYYLGNKANNEKKKAEACTYLKRASELGSREALIDLGRFCK